MLAAIQASALPAQDTCRIEEILLHIDRELEKNAPVFTRIEYRYGILGLSLYNYAASRFYPSGNSFAKKGEEYLFKAFGMLNDGYLSSRLYKELAEAGEYLEYCRRLGFYQEDTNELLNDFDEVLYTCMKEELAAQNFDPANGALAYGYYFLRRLPSTDAVRPILKELAEALVHISLKNEKGVYWKSKLKGDDSIYLGITHGSANIICFLILLTNAGVVGGLEELIRDAALYIKNNQLPEGPIVFPVVVGESQEKKLYSDNWCYGDIGTAYGVFQAARHLHDTELYNYSLEIFRKLSERKDQPPYLIAGFGLLYGYSGIALVYRHLFELTGCDFFLESYRKAAARILDNFNPDDEFLGYRGYWNQEMPVTNYSFYEGICGISLLLMAFSKDEHYQYLKPFFYLF